MSLTSSRRLLPAVFVLLLSGASVAAHDLWIEPTVFLADAGKVVGVRLRVGQDLQGDPVPRDPDLINEFVVVEPTGRKPVVGRDGADPAGLLRVSGPGLLVVGYRSNPSPIVLTAEKFNQYIKDEGLDAVAAQRALRHQTSAEAKEIFARCAKSLLLSGAPSEAQHDQALGFTLELVAERNPYVLRAGDELPVRLTYEGRPLAGALVIALNRVDPAARMTARSDKDGRVRFRLPSGGFWLIKAVHMIPAPAGSNAEWASFWASLTFDLKGQAAGSASR
jgi:uncharacterized GH25 family protein